MQSRGLMSWDDLEALPRPAPDRTLSYGDDPLQVVDLWLPKGPGPHRAVIMLHGGCWQTDVADRAIMNRIAGDLRGRGIAVWNVDYRGVDRAGGGWPRTYEDVEAAVRLFAARGAAEGLRTDRLIVIGHSAGGHLALWLAQRPGSPRIDAAISSGGLPDLEYLTTATDHGCGTEGAAAMAGTPPRFAATSPIAMPAARGRVVQINGDQDRIAPPAFAERYAEAIDAKGGATTNVVVPDSGHVELIAPGSDAWEQTVALIEAELAR